MCEENRTPQNAEELDENLKRRKKNLKEAETHRLGFGLWA